MSTKDFFYEWKDYGFKTALDNWLIEFTKKFIGAKRITIQYPRKTILKKGSVTIGV